MLLLRLSKPVFFEMFFVMYLDEFSRVASSWRRRLECLFLHRFFSDGDVDKRCFNLLYYLINTVEICQVATLSFYIVVTQSFIQLY